MSLATRVTSIAFALLLMIGITPAKLGFAGGGGGGGGPTNNTQNYPQVYANNLPLYQGMEVTIAQDNDGTGFLLQLEYRTAETYEVQSYRIGTPITLMSNPDIGQVQYPLTMRPGIRAVVSEWKDDKDKDGRGVSDGIMDELVLREYRPASQTELELDRLREEFRSDLRSQELAAIHGLTGCQALINGTQPVNGSLGNTYQVSERSSLFISCGVRQWNLTVYPGDILARNQAGTDWSYIYGQRATLCEVLKWMEPAWSPQSQVSPEVNTFCRVFSRSTPTIEAQLRWAGFREMTDYGMVFKGGNTPFIWEGEPHGRSILASWHDVPCADFGQDPCQLPSATPDGPKLNLGSNSIALPWNVPFAVVPERVLKGTKPYFPLYRVSKGGDGRLTLQEAD